MPCHAMAHPYKFRRVLNNVEAPSFGYPLDWFDGRKTMPRAHHYYCGGLGFVIPIEYIHWNPHGRVVVQKQQPPSSSMGKIAFIRWISHLSHIICVAMCICFYATLVWWSGASQPMWFYICWYIYIGTRTWILSRYVLYTCKRQKWVGMNFVCFSFIQHFIWRRKHVIYVSNLAANNTHTWKVCLITPMGKTLILAPHFIWN